jgi:hypothetical protein
MAPTKRGWTLLNSRDQLDRAWWQDYRAHLEQLCDQESIVIRAEQIEVL